MEYYVTFIDEATCYAVVYLLSKKSKAIEAFKAYLSASPHAMCCWSLVTDQRGEYLLKGFWKLLCKCSIAHDTTAVHSPELNGITEHFNQTIMVMVQSLLTNSHLPCAMWDEALRMATHINNWLPTRAKDGRTPHELWTGELPTYEHLHLFRCQAHVLWPTAMRSKLDDCSAPAIYLSPARDSTHHHHL
jgi:hypothetical protein